MAEKQKKHKFSFFSLKRGTWQEKNLTPESAAPTGTSERVAAATDRLNATRPAENRRDF